MWYCYWNFISWIFLRRIKCIPHHSKSRLTRTTCFHPPVFVKAFLSSFSFWWGNTRCYVSTWSVRLVNEQIFFKSNILHCIGIFQRTMSMTQNCFNVHGSNTLIKNAKLSIISKCRSTYKNMKYEVNSKQFISILFPFQRLHVTYRSHMQVWQTLLPSRCNANTYNLYNL